VLIWATTCRSAVSGLRGRTCSVHSAAAAANAIDRARTFPTGCHRTPRRTDRDRRSEGPWTLDSLRPDGWVITGRRTTVAAHPVGTVGLTTKSAIPTRRVRQLEGLHVHRTLTTGLWTRTAGLPAGMAQHPFPGHQAAISGTAGLRGRHTRRHGVRRDQPGIRRCRRFGVRSAGG
jgi:hypothetical protein